MSEKRFEVINARWQGKGEAVSFEDTQTNQVYFAENQEECERIVELLNELSEEKEYFERKKEHFLSKWSIDNAENIQLRQENKELKKENDNKFKFNVNQAKAYHIKSISPNGVVRTGKKNSKVSWRMKDVREISQELPPFEDFNRETLQGISNKFHTKFDNDVVGRIIYNIYVGTFDEYI